MLCQGDPEKQRIARSEANAPAAGQQELLYGPSGRKRCQDVEKVEKVL
jgi:hypothetical protein